MRHDIINIQNYALYLDPELSHLQKFIETRGYSNYVVIGDTNTMTLCFPKIEHLFSHPPHRITFPAGETNKSFESLTLIWEEMIQFQIDRKALIILLGGGVTGDMGGFAASTFKRGTDFIHIPTTLMAMTDSSIGGKLGIDHQYIKNVVGLFNNPKGIFIHLDFLTTLPDEEMRSGIAEVIKHALISDAKLFEHLVQLTDFTRPTINYDILYRSVLVKKALVERDPLESSVRKALNFGHTIGHAIESALLQSGQPITHGEAVILGMIAESYISFKSGLILNDHYQKIKNFLLNYCDPKKIQHLHKEVLLTFMMNDKKNESGTILFSLLNGIGSYSINKPVPPEIIHASIDAIIQNQ